MLNVDFSSALDHYFSPKKKSPKHGSSPNKKIGASPKRIQRALDFEEECDSSEESVKTVVPTKNLKCNLELLSLCFQNIDQCAPVSEWIKHYNNWTGLTEGFNLLIYGVGSKRELLEHFGQHALAEFNHVICDGFDPRVNVRSIFDYVVLQFALESTLIRKESLRDWALRIEKEVDEKSLTFYILLNNIDGRALRDPIQQEALSILARSNHVHLIATIDHVNGTMLWDQKTRDSFNWLLVPFSTMRVCGGEMLAGESKILGLDIKQSGWSHNMASLEVFWQATTQNSRKILQQLAIHAGSTKDKKSEEGSTSLMLPDFCKILRIEFATTSEPVLRQQLTEFIDHQLIHIDRDGCIQLTVDRNLVASFLDSKLND
uniref:Origin recognition complex subunit 2 n=1 Tax=Ditylenchus dipsaci TaxID=166011 RepID=A0A915DZM4_9BILA